MAAEIWDLYDANGCLTGKTMKRGEEVPLGLYHLGVHIADKFISRDHTLS